MVFLLWISISFGELVGSPEPAQAPILTGDQRQCEREVNSDACKQFFRENPEFLPQKQNCRQEQTVEKVVNRLKICGKNFKDGVIDPIIGLFGAPKLNATGVAMNKVYKSCFENKECRRSAFAKGAHRKVSEEELKRLDAFAQKEPDSWRRVQDFGLGLTEKTREWKQNEQELFLLGLFPGNPEFDKEMKKRDPYWMPDARILYQSQSLSQSAMDAVSGAASALKKKGLMLFCLNNETKAEMVCYGYGMLVDPTAVAGLALKSKKLAKFFGGKAANALNGADRADIFLDNNLTNALVENSVSMPAHQGRVTMVENFAKFFNESPTGIYTREDVFNRVGTTPTLRNELDKMDDGVMSGRLPSTGEVPNPQTLQILETAGIGSAKGSADRLIVAELLAESKKRGKPVTFFTADRKLFNGLARFSVDGIDPGRVDLRRYANTGFEVEINGDRLHVVPVFTH